MKKIVIFASGSGSNAENIVQFCRKKQFATVLAIGTNNANAKVLDRAKNMSIPTFIFTKNELFSDDVLYIIDDLAPDLIVLAGFLLKFPEKILKKYTNKVINIHPALLPKYGGKGMFGLNVHTAVLKNKEVESGITIHYVNENYDEGAIIFQKSVSITNCLIANDVAIEINKLEMKYFPQVIEKLLTGN